jgi:cyclic pyranopterin monophosphate synthase
MSQFTHLNEEGQVNMVDIAHKTETQRTATAQAVVWVGHKVLDLLKTNQVEKGDVWAMVRIAGIQAAKKTADIIPLCHPLSLSSVKIEIAFSETTGEVSIQSICQVTGKTGVEMEALTAVSGAALALYDMCKSIDKGIEIRSIFLIEKTGGKSGRWVRDGRAVS